MSVVKEEVLRGQTKLVLCRADETALYGAPDDLAKQQFEDARQIKDDADLSKDNLSRLVKTVGRMMEAVEIRRAGGASSARDPFEPYLIDRTEQERQARSAIDRAMSGGVEALFVKGPKNECIDRFRERLKIHTSRGVLDGATWSEALVTWPSVDPLEFTDAYAESLAQSLVVAPRRLFDQLGALRGALLSPMSVVALAEWDKAQPARVKAWLAFWRDAASKLPHLHAAPLLAVELPETRHANWKQFPGERHKGVSARRIHRDMEAVLKGAKNEGLAPLTRLEILRPVAPEDADHWVRHVAGEAHDDERDSLEEIAKAAFMKGKKKLKRVSMADFARAVRPLYSG